MTSPGRDTDRVYNGYVLKPEEHNREKETKSEKKNEHASCRSEVKN